MKVRAHHLICLLAFKGKGYSKSFVEQFSKMRKFYIDNKDATIGVITSPDDACKECPYLEKGGCAFPADGPESRVVEFDKEALALLGIEEGRYRVPEIHKRLKEIDLGRVESFCKKCSWHDKLNCHQIIKKTIKHKLS